MRLLVAILVSSVLGGGSYAFAATLLTNSKTLAAGKAPVTACDSDGFAYTRTLDGSHNVATVTVSGIAAACSGGTLRLTLARGANAPLASGAGPVTASAPVAVAITGAAPAGSVNAYHVAIAS